MLTHPVAYMSSTMWAARACVVLSTALYPQMQSLTMVNPHVSASACGSVTARCPSSLSIWKTALSNVRADNHCWPADRSVLSTGGRSHLFPVQYICTGLGHGRLKAGIDIICLQPEVHRCYMSLGGDAHGALRARLGIRKGSADERDVSSCILAVLQSEHRLNHARADQPGHDKTCSHNKTYACLAMHCNDDLRQPDVTAESVCWAGMDPREQSRCIPV